MESAKKSLRLIFIIIGVLWVIVISFFDYYFFKIDNKKTEIILLQSSRAFFKIIILTRYWNALHGGVYAKITSSNRPNPYLKVPYRDLETKSGIKLTLINPAYMTRQISGLAKKEDIYFHITSLNPIRPQNKPFKWEVKALKSFLKGKKEFYEIYVSKDGKKIFRYMAPLKTKKVCLKCHAAQGYREGDIRGGISISFPIDKILNLTTQQFIKITIALFLICMLGIAGLVICFKVLENKIEEIRILRGLIPICASCKKIRTDKGYWQQLEEYFSTHSDISFSHGLCPDCIKKLYPEVADKFKE